MPASRLATCLVAALLASPLTASGPPPDPPDCVDASGSSATVLLPDDPGVRVDGGPLQPGDWIAALSPDGTCVGRARWSGTGTSLTIWTDDLGTSGADGLADGDPVSFVVYRGQHLFPVEITFETAFDPTGGVTLDGAYVVSSATSTAAPWNRAGAVKNILAPIRPNPVVQTAEIVLALDAPAEVQVDILDVLGRRVAVLLDGPLGAGDHALTLDVSSLTAGTYVCWVRSGRSVFQRQFTVAR